MVTSPASALLGLLPHESAPAVQNASVAAKARGKTAKATEKKR